VYCTVDIAIWDLIEALTVAILNGLLAFVLLSVLDQNALSWITGVNTVTINRRSTALLESGATYDDQKYRKYQIKFCHRLFFGIVAGLISFVVSFISLILGIGFYTSSISASIVSSLLVLLGLRFSGTFELPVPVFHQCRSEVNLCRSKGVRCLVMN